MGRADGLGIGLLPAQGPGRAHRLDGVAEGAAAEAGRAEPALHAAGEAGRAAEPGLAGPGAGGAGAAGAVARELRLRASARGDVLRPRGVRRDVLPRGGLDAAGDDQGLLPLAADGGLLRAQRPAQGALGQAPAAGRVRGAVRRGAAARVPPGLGQRRLRRPASAGAARRVPARRALLRARPAREPPGCSTSARCSRCWP